MSWHNAAKPQARQWRRVRLAVLDRDSWACVRCGKNGRLEVDHIRSLEHGGAMYDLKNLQCLCRNCHIEKSRAERPHYEPSKQVEAWKAFIEERIANGV